MQRSTAKKNSYLDSRIFPEKFHWRLLAEIKNIIRLLQPSSLEQALKLVGFYEEFLPVAQKKVCNTGEYNKSGITRRVQ